MGNLYLGNLILLKKKMFSRAAEKKFFFPLIYIFEIRKYRLRKVFELKPFLQKIFHLTASAEREYFYSNLVYSFCLQFFEII